MKKSTATRFSFIVRAAVLLGVFSVSVYAEPAAEKPATHLKDEMRVPWSRSNERFIRHWQVLGEIPLAADFEKDPLAAAGGEAALVADEKAPVTLPAGKKLAWRAVTAWGDAVDLSDGVGLKRDLVGYAFTKVSRAAAGKALLSFGSDESARVWINGTLVLDRRGPRPLAFDEDRVEVDLRAGDNNLLVKLEQHTGPWNFAVRVLESGAIPPRVDEISPSFTLESPASLVARTDLAGPHTGEAAVTVSVVAPGGKILADKSAARGDTVRFDPSSWADGPYDLRFVTHRLDGLAWAKHVPWYKGDALAAARTLVDAAAKADVTTPAGQTLKMLADMVLDRDRTNNFTVTGNPWWVLHSPLTEWAELKLEAAGQKSARARSYGFYRLAWRDDIDGSPQFCRAYLPGGYDPQKKYPLVVRLHGYNPANPVYVRWWSVDGRHSSADREYADHEGVIFVEPHGRGNTQYLGLGDADVLRVIREAKKHFSIDDDRVYLSGESMGGWGTWNAATRHPDLFAAIAPVFGGADYHSQLTEEQLAALTPFDRFLQEKSSSWSMADGLLHTPILVLHGDADHSVNVDFSRYGVRQLQRWGYDVRYIEMPGYGHEDLNRTPTIVDWLLTHRRVASPRHVRLRSAELQHASAYWVTVDAFDRPNDFMVVDAELVAPNSLRVDSQNVLALTLTPSTSLIDSAKSVSIVWNGDPQTAAVEHGRIALRSPADRHAAVAKTARIAGPLSDVFNTPFAVVTGTASADPAMNEICAEKSAALASFWQQWQNQPLRQFKDSEISDADLARYSLILIGGPDANLVARKFAAQLPLELAVDHVAIFGRSFSTTDARVQLIFPHPLNPDRYIVLAAATSTTAMEFWAPAGLPYESLDFTIEDGHVADVGQQASASEIDVASGWFGRDWSLDDAVVIPGDAGQRAKSLVLRGPLDAQTLEAYLGDYEIGPGAVLKLSRGGPHLVATVAGQPDLRLIPVGNDKFYISEAHFTVVFDRDAAGKVTALKGNPGGREFVAKKTN